MTASMLAATFTQLATAAPVVAPVAVPALAAVSYSQLKTPAVAMTALLDDLRRHGDVYTAEDAVHFADTLGGAGQDTSYQSKMSGVRDSVLAQIAPRLAQDGLISRREFMGAMAQAGNAIPAAKPQESALHPAADLLVSVGLAPRDKLVNGFAKLGEAISLQAQGTAPRSRVSAAPQMAMAYNA